MRSVVLACEHACAGACPDRRRVAGHPSRTSGGHGRDEGTREERRCTAIEKRRGEERRERETRGERRCRPLGSKAQKNSVACHGAESTPKIHSLAPLSHVCKVARTLQNALLDGGRDVATSESISESGLGMAVGNTLRIRYYRTHGGTRRTLTVNLEFAQTLIVLKEESTTVPYIIR